jgi:hypothetical protein
VFDLESVHRLLEVRRGSLDHHGVSDGDRSVREPDRRDPDLPEEVEDLSDLSAFHSDRRMGCAR